jgi:2-polyprenyl-3-methyl-5-hydroxy-6-metoxy-1,4-benzoquinol methylase
MQYRPVSSDRSDAHPARVKQSGHNLNPLHYSLLMTITKLVRAAADVLISLATRDGSQNFLGARWVEWTVSNMPAMARERVALRFLSLSPHYFYDRDLAAEADRNRRSRQILADELIAQHLTSGSRVVDYGCGPGYLAAAVARKVAHVNAIDISRGALACARALNGLPNITYQTPEEFCASGDAADVAYSFAVVQHLRTDVLVSVLGLLAAVVRPGGVLLLHFAVTSEQGYRTEGQWLSDMSLVGQTKIRYGLNCFGRSAAEMVDLVTRNGFTDVVTSPLRGVITIPGDDIPNQYLLTARRAFTRVPEMVIT